MAYSTNPNLIKARRQALKEVLLEKLPVCVVARRSGVHRSTIWRWIKKWQWLNRHISFENTNRPSRPVGRAFRWSGVNWVVPTLSSAPHSHPWRIASWIVDRILKLRETLGRCADAIHLQLAVEHVRVSLSSVKRTLKRHGLCERQKKRPYRRTLPRPLVTTPGALVEIDTVHYVNQLTKERRYIFTVIDLYSRMSYAKAFTGLLPGNALKTILEAENSWRIKLQTVQSDNGPEFGRWLSERLGTRGITHRKTRIHRPNDNAHIERFNRTLREECIGNHMRSKLTTALLNQKLLEYIDYYNQRRLHLGIQCTPGQMLRR
jgi:putative transposase